MVKRIIQSIRGTLKPRSAVSDEIQVVSREEILERAERLSREALNVDGEQAFKLLREGKLRGTILGAELERARFLLGDDHREARA